MKTKVEVTEVDLQRAYRSLKLVNTTFEICMTNPALSIAIRRTAESEVRRQLRLVELQRNDRKRAQANDQFNYETDND